MDISIIQGYAPTTKSSDEDMDRFYAPLDQAYSQCKSQDIIIVMGDFNAKGGNERVDSIVGPHGLGSRNERGEMLVEWAQTNNMMIGNTWFKQPPRRLWTWLSPDDHTLNQIDYILVNKRFRNSPLASETLPGADCYSDHVPVMGRFRAKMRTLKKPTLREQLDVSLLQKDNTIKEKYAVEVKNRFSALEDLDSIEDHWKGLKVSIMDAANEVLGRAMHKKIREITNKKTQSSSGFLKSKTGGIIMERDRILERWSEYLNELFDDERNTERTIDLEMSAPPIMEDEVRVRNKIKPEIAEEQCGLVEGKGTANATYILRNIIERSLEVQKNIYMCFLDYSKAFNKIAAMRVDNEIGEYQKIGRVVRQGCVLSPDLFSIYSEIIMHSLECLNGIKIDGNNINNLRYADDTVLLAETEEYLQSLLNTVITESERKGLSINNTKTKTMVVIKKGQIPTCNITANRIILKQEEKFKYLGALITSDGRCLTEVSCRIGQAKAAFQSMSNIMRNRNISLNIRKQLLQCYIEPILMYGCEAWTIDSQVAKKIKAAEIAMNVLIGHGLGSFSGINAHGFVRGKEFGPDFYGEQRIRSRCSVRRTNDICDSLDSGGGIGRACDSHLQDPGSRPE
ncbi:uncharacterized protein LOC134771333 [Penaeus indicus]|uniref:uncharacterized protein LOC134771333 n=1 Tax=Penaeus indicus TaxID=29960 RepID=UPI00300CB055